MRIYLLIALLISFSTLGNQLRHQPTDDCEELGLNFSRYTTSYNTLDNEFDPVATITMVTDKHIHYAVSSDVSPDLVNAIDGDMNLIRVNVESYGSFEMANGNYTLPDFISYTDRVGNRVHIKDATVKLTVTVLKNNHELPAGGDNYVKLFLRCKKA